MGEVLENLRYNFLISKLIDVNCQIIVGIF